MEALCPFCNNKETHCTCPVCDECQSAPCVCALLNNQNMCTLEPSCTCNNCRSSWREECPICKELVHPDQLFPFDMCDACKKDITGNTDKHMAPVEIQGNTDKRWRQFRDKANKSNFLRMAIKDLTSKIEERAEEHKQSALDTAEAMTLGGIHPNTHHFMN